MIQEGFTSNPGEFCAAMLAALRRSAHGPRVVAAAACASSSQAPPWRLAERELQQQNVRLRDVSTGADYVALVARLEAEQRAASRAAVGVRRSASPPLGEATYSVLIRSAVEAGDVAAAARLLERMKARSPERPRRRAYAPLLAAHSLDASARERVDDLWQDMVRDDVALSESDYACLFRSRLAGPPAGVDEVLERLGRDAGVFAIASRTAAAMARDADAAPGWSATYERVGADGTTRFGALKRLALDGADRAQLRAAVLRAAGRRGGAQRERLEAFAEAFDRRCAAAPAKTAPHAPAEGWAYPGGPRGRAGEAPAGERQRTTRASQPEQARQVLPGSTRRSIKGGLAIWGVLCEAHAPEKGAKTRLASRRS